MQRTRPPTSSYPARSACSLLPKALKPQTERQPVEKGNTDDGANSVHSIWLMAAAIKQLSGAISICSFTSLECPTCPWMSRLSDEQRPCGRPRRGQLSSWPCLSQWYQGVQHILVTSPRKRPISGKTRIAPARTTSVMLLGKTEGVFLV